MQISSSLYFKWETFFLNQPLPPSSFQYLMLIPQDQCYDVSGGMGITGWQAVGGDQDVWWLKVAHVMAAAMTANTRRWPNSGRRGRWANI